MKRIMILLGAVAVLFTAGCATPANTNGAPTTGISAEQIQASAIALRTLSRSAATIAIEEKPDNAKYVTLAVTTLDQFLVGTDYTPGALTKALQPVVKEVSDVKIRLAIDTVSDLYEAFYGRYARQQIAGNETARLLLTALRDGASQAIELQPAAK